MISNIAQSIPVKVREWIYVILGTAFGIEAVLDAVGEGLVDEKTQGIILGVLGVVGFSVARLNTPSPQD